MMSPQIPGLAWATHVSALRGLCAQRRNDAGLALNSSQSERQRDASVDRGEVRDAAAEQPVAVMREGGGEGSQAAAAVPRRMSRAPWIFGGGPCVMVRW